MQDSRPEPLSAGAPLERVSRISCRTAGALARRLQMTPQVSVIVPVYNALDLTQQCVESIFEAGADLSFEVIVVDNGSELDVQEWLADVAARRPQLRYL